MIKNVKKKLLDKYFQKYFLNKQYKFNNKVLLKLKINPIKVKKILEKFGYFYDDQNLSWHHHIFAGLSSNKKKRILEIGTFDGKFANFLSKIFPKSKIITCDLDDKNSFFRKTYKRDNKIYLKEFLNKRYKNINKKNIEFIKIDSFYLIDYFLNEKFDMIWVDGNHLGPQVQFDIFQSIKILKKGGYFMVDDIIKKNFNHAYGSTESFKTLQFLDKMHGLKTNYIFKRLWTKNLSQEKFISITKV